MTDVVFAWLNQVKADPRLLASDFKTAFQLTQKTSTDTFVKTGVLVTWQSRSFIATEIKMGERTVHDAIKRLVDGGHVSIDAGHGPGRSNRYSLIDNGQQSAAYNGQQSAAYKRQNSTAIEAEHCSNSGSLPPTNNSYNNSDNSSRADARASHGDYHRAGDAKKRSGERDDERHLVHPGTPAFDAWHAEYERLNAQNGLKMLRECKSRGEPARMPSMFPKPPIARAARAPP